MPIYLETKDSLELKPINVVGTLLCFNDTFLGPGIYRGAAEAVVNVAGGGTILTPALAKLN